MALSHKCNKDLFLIHKIVPQDKFKRVNFQRLVSTYTTFYEFLVLHESAVCILGVDAINNTVRICG